MFSLLYTSLLSVSLTCSPPLSRARCLPFHGVLLCFVPHFLIDSHSSPSLSSLACSLRSSSLFSFHHHPHILHCHFLLSSHSCSCSPSERFLQRCFTADALVTHHHRKNNISRPMVGKLISACHGVFHGFSLFWLVHQANLRVVA